MRRIPGASPMRNNRNTEQPFRLTRAQAVTCSQSHDYTREQRAFNSGLMDKFVEFTSVSTASCDQGLGRKLVMGYYDGNTVTAMWNYAQHFAMSDNYFASTFGPRHQARSISSQARRMARKSFATPAMPTHRWSRDPLSPISAPLLTIVCPAARARCRCRARMSATC
jgi:hypothetical protein